MMPFWMLSDCLPLLFVTWLTVPVYCLPNAPETQLWNHLMSTTGYDRNLRPIVDDPHKQMEVDFQFSLARLESLNEKSQVMTTFGWMGLLWTDELLTWDPADFGGMYRLVVPGDLIWLPEVAMMNSVEQGNDLSMTSKFRTTIFADGSVSWNPGFKWQTSCAVNLVAFPYDTQECNVTFVNWVYQVSQLNFTVNNPFVDLSVFEPNGEWQIIFAITSRMDFRPSPTVDMHIPTVTFTLSLKRKPAFYELNVLAPSMIMTFISALVFCLPAESGEKIGLGITVLLSYSVVLLMVSDITPRSSSVPILTVYIVTSMGLTAISLVGTIIILNVFHHNPRKSVPGWTKSAAFRRCAICLCMDPGDTQGTNAVYPITDMIPLHETNGDGKKSLKDCQEKAAWDSTADMKMPEELLVYFQAAKQKDLDSDIIEKNRADWQHLAAILDRIIFVFFCIVIVIVGVSVMGLMRY